MKAIGKTEYAEVRIDQLNLSEEQLRSLFAIKKKSIATCRPGKFDDAKRLALLKYSIDSGAGYVDVEYEAKAAYRKELIDYAHTKHAYAIISYHNFEKTPSAKAINAIIEQSFKWGANRVKITTMAITPADCSRVMALYEKNKNIIAFCMGQMGTITRIAAPLLGAEFTFASLEAKLATAPGQLEIEEMKDIYNMMK
jgi:3-dehydroquinate dehydratase-1